MAKTKSSSIPELMLDDAQSDAPPKKIALIVGGDNGQRYEYVLQTANEKTKSRKRGRPENKDRQAADRAQVLISEGLYHSNAFDIVIREFPKTLGLISRDNAHRRIRVAIRKYFPFVWELIHDPSFKSEKTDVTWAELEAYRKGEYALADIPVDDPNQKTRFRLPAWAKEASEK